MAALPLDFPHLNFDIRRNFETTIEMAGQ